MAASEWVSGVDIAVTGNAESGGVGFASEARRSLFTDLTHPHARVAGRELVGGVNLGVASDTEEGGVGSAEEARRRGFAGVAEGDRHGPALFGHGSSGMRLIFDFGFWFFGSENSFSLRLSNTAIHRQWTIQLGIDTY